jgi:molybdopterin molybdotransferase
LKPIDYNIALRLVLENTRRLKSEVIGIEDALGLFLAQDVFAVSDLPRFTSSAVDGYGVKVSDVLKTNRKNPITLKLIGEIKAGDVPKIRMKQNGTLRILTGAPIPNGVEAVVMKEDTECVGKNILFTSSAKFNENIRCKGEEFKKGAKIISSGSELNPAAVGVLASLGISKIKVYKIPTVSVLVTGNELVPLGKKLTTGQIHDSNYFTLSSSLRQIGIEANNLGIANDDKKDLLTKVQKGLSESDVLIVSGGISVGEFDFVQEIFNQLKIKKIFWRIAIKPGKPTFFGIKGRKLIFGLPGNPVASLLIFNQFVKPALKKMMGEKNNNPLILTATLDSNIKKSPGRLELVRGILSADESGTLTVTPSKLRGSHMLGGMVDANCLIYFPKQLSQLNAGSKVKVELMNE